MIRSGNPTAILVDTPISGLIPAAETNTNVTLNPDNIKAWLLLNLSSAGSFSEESLSEINANLRIAEASSYLRPVVQSNLLPYAVASRFAKRTDWTLHLLKAWNEPAEIFVEKLYEAILNRPVDRDRKRWVVFLRLGCQRACLFMEVFSSAEARVIGRPSGEGTFVLSQISYDTCAYASYFESIKNNADWANRIWPGLFRKDASESLISEINVKGRSATLKDYGWMLNLPAVFVPPLLESLIKPNNLAADPVEFIKKAFQTCYLREAQAHEIEYFSGFAKTSYFQLMVFEGLFYSDEAYQIGLPRDWINYLITQSRVDWASALPVLLVSASDEQFVRFSFFHSQDQPYDQGQFEQLIAAARVRGGRLRLLRDKRHDWPTRTLIKASCLHYGIYWNRQFKRIIRWALGIPSFKRKQKWT